MKVDTEESCAPWVESLSIRIQLPLPSAPDYSTFEPSDEVSGLDSTSSLYLHWDEFTRASEASLMALRSLPVEAPLVLFTPFLVPAGSSDDTLDGSRRKDPFETFGRRLAEHHPNICHVPYVSSLGFTDTHLGFIMQSEAVITVVCEPKHFLKHESMHEQHDFAEAALKAFVSRPTTLPGDGEFVLAQCATEDARLRAPYAFANVVETELYDDPTAKHLADTILGRT